MGSGRAAAPFSSRRSTRMPFRSPPGFKEARVEPEGAFYHREMGEFILPYEAVRKSPSPDAALVRFLDTTYDRAAALAGWDRAALERHSRV